jgi:hypothetical protein
MLSDEAKRLISYLLAVSTGVSATFVAGAAAENVHSFAFAVYVGGTVIFLLCFIASLRD